jgi:hypothetical protein
MEGSKGTEGLGRRAAPTRTAQRAVPTWELIAEMRSLKRAAVKAVDAGVVWCMVYSINESHF